MYFSDISDRIISFYNRIKRVIKWSKIVYSDRFNEYDSLLIYIKEKIIDIKSDLSDHRTDKMGIIISLIDKVETEYYKDESFDYYYLDLNIDGDKFLDIKMVDNKTYEYFLKYPTWYKRALKVNQDKTYDSSDDFDFSMIVVMSNLRHEKANELAFKLIERNIFSWWD